MKNHLVYSHCDPRGQVFYVGCGLSKRAYGVHNRGSLWHQKIKKIDYFEVRILFASDNYEEALGKEKYFIAGLRPECNVIDGHHCPVSRTRVNGITMRQHEVLTYIRDHIDDEGWNPTIGQITQHFGWQSPNSAMCHIRVLAKKGFVTKTARGYFPT